MILRSQGRMVKIRFILVWKAILLEMEKAAETAVVVCEGFGIDDLRFRIYDLRLLISDLRITNNDYQFPFQLTASQVPTI